MRRRETPSGIRKALARFNTAFALMSVIPILICYYLVTVRFFSVWILVGMNGAYFLLAVIVALLGLLAGRLIIQDVVKDLVEANLRSERLVAELARVNEQLQQELTQRRKAEEQLQRANTELTLSHDELQSTQLQLIQAAKMESVGRLAAGVAHEVKNPLAIILAGVEALSRYLKSPDQEVTSVLRDIDESVTRADAVIRGLLDFSAQEDLDMHLDELNPAVEQALALVKHELAASHIALVKTVGQDLPRLWLDRHKIEQTFVNLFMNAIHAMPHGGTLTVRTSVRRFPSVLPEVSVGHRKTDRFQVGETVVAAEVEDTGSGIPSDKLPKVFDPFFTTKPAGKGTGLGLTVTRKIIELHGGTIEIENRQEGGIRVTLLFKSP